MKKIPHVQNSSKIYLENRSLSRAKFDTPNTLIYDRLLYWLCIGTSIKLVLI